MTDNVPSWCRLGYFIDAKDSMNDWCVAQVTEICEIKKTVTVIYDGWGMKTGTYPFKSSKIAPFRKNTLKYTGPKRGAVRDWNINEKELTEMQGQLDTILDSNLQSGDAFIITQFYRGKLFIFVENLLTCTYKIHKQFLKPVVFFFGSVIKLIVAWLKKAPELFPFYYKAASLPELYLEDSNVALALVWPELMDTLNKLFALESRVADFFQTYDSVPDDYEPSPFTLMKDKKYSETLMFLINSFTKENGFEAVIAILSEKDEQKRVPFPFIATTLLYVLGQFIVPDFWAKFNMDMTAAVYQRIDIISELELKDLKHEDIIRVLGMIKDSNENLDVKKMNFFLRMIKSNYFEKRIKGLSEINTIIENLDNKLESSKTKISREGLRDWILKNNVIELVVSDRPHVELIKRCSPLFKFLALCKALEPAHLEILWNSMQGKHESYVRATYLALMEFVPCLSEDLNEHLYVKIKAVPLNQYDESFLMLIKDFTATALVQSIRYALQNRRDYNKIFGLEILEHLMLDSAPVDFSRLACKHIGAIFTHPLTRKLLDTYIKKIIALVVSNDSAPQALKLLRKLLKGMKDLKRISAEIGQLNNEHDLVKLILKNLKLYLESSRASGGNDVWGKIVFGRFTHENNIRIRLQFIEFLIVYSNGLIGLSDDNIKAIWEMLGESQLENEKKIFFDWVTKGIKRRPPLDVENISFMFTYLMMDDEKFPVANLSEEAFACFKWVFLNYHFNEENIELFNHKLKYRKEKTLIGFEKLILIQLNSEKVTADAAKLIISLLLRYSLSTISTASEIQEEFTESLLRIILEHKDNEFIVTRGLNLFKMLLGNDDQEFSPNTYIYVNELLTRDFQKLFYDQTRTIRHLRKEVARIYKKPLESVILQCSDKRYSGIDDDFELSMVKSHCVTVEFKNSDYKEHNPLPGLSMNQQVIKTLFELLSNTEMPYTNVAWSLLVSLPTNQKLEEAFEALDEPIYKMLDQTSMHKLLYELMIIQKLSLDSHWAQRFVEAKGLEDLLKIFYNEPSGSHAALRQESLLKTIANFLDTNVDIEDLPRFISVFFSALLMTVQSKDEIKEPESLSKAIEEIIKFITDQNSHVLKTYIIENIQVIQDVFIGVLLGKLKPGLTSSIEKQLENIAEAAGLFDVFFQLLFDMREKAFIECNEKYWKLFAFIVKYAENIDMVRETLITELVNYVKNSPYAKSSNDKNESLCGVLSVIANAWTSKIPVERSHMELFLIKCLFEIPESLDRNTLVPPICKHPDTRRSTFEVILELCKNSETFTEMVIKELEKFHEEPDWRGPRRAEWSISAVSKEKSQAGLVGIKNLGCTCYMNSLLQQLFMLKSFRDGILASSTEAFDENLLYQLQYLFSSLQGSDKQYINPKAFANTIKDFDGNPINLNEQMDVDEFFNYFMDKLEGYLKDTPHHNMIKTHFGGLLVTELIGKDCIHRSERYEPFLSVSVEVKNKKSIQEGLESFVAGEMLEGENAYQCDHCEAKVRAVRRVCIKHLPNFLLIALRRFEFDFDSMTRVKLNDFCEFPLEINMEPYTQEGLDRQEKEKEKLLNKDVQVPLKKFHDDYYNYKLRGIVIHAGTAETGHYYSYIREAMPKNWFEFNDIWIKEFNPDDIPDECFGGEEKFSWSSTFSNSPNTGIREKCGNAYLLFYERTGLYQVRNPDDEVLEPTSFNVNPSGELAHLAIIRKQNQKYWRNKHIFANEYSNFVYNLSKSEIIPFKFVMKFTLTILMRTREKNEKFVYMYLRLEKEIKKVENAKWMLELIGVSSVCKELLLYCPIVNMRKIVVGFVKTALTSVDQPSCEKFMLKILALLPFAKKQYTRNYAQYLEVLKLSVLSCQESIDQYKVIDSITRYLLGKEFSLPERPEDSENDVYLGYDRFQITDNEKIDTFFTDSKSTSHGHIFHLLYLISNQIPEAILNELRQANVIEDLLRNVDTKLAIKYFGSLYADFMSENKDLVICYLRKLFEFFQTSDFFSRSKCYKLFTPFLLKKSALQAEIIDIFLKHKHKQMRISKYINEVELFLSYIFSLCAKSAEFQGFLKQQGELLQWSEKWIKDNMHYGFANTKPSQFEDSVRPTLKVLYLKCQKVLKNEELFNANYWDSGEEVDEEKLQKNKYIDTVEGNGQHWTKGLIKERIGDLLYLQIKSWDNTEFSTLKEAYGDEIAPAGHYTSKSSMHS